ncbi:MAG: PCRF domain-containing protein, partial [Chloroflexia bacterium]
MQFDELEKLINDPEFWNNPEKSQEVMQKRKRLDETLSQDRRIATMNSDVAALIELAREGEDVVDMLNGEMTTLRDVVSQLETGMLLSGEQDHLSAILNIHPGAGGTESQDWAEMLMRMYIMWGESKGFTVKQLSYQPGEGAGIKSASLEIDGPFPYGYLKSEIGVHRLVRMSP